MSISTNQIKDYWKKIESKSAPPRFVKKVSIINFEIFRKNLKDKKEFYIKSIIKRMYSGEAFIIRNAAKKNLKETILKLAKHYDKKHKPSFHKMIDGTPNFHRIYDTEITKKYSLYAIKHSYFFTTGTLKLN
tara:strand:+ start:256 stop:651 length:396 start_codon:yes stop_codon:yes gene_type:complete